MLSPLAHDSQQCNNIQSRIRKHHVTTSVELQKQPVQPVRELELNDPVCADLGDGCDAPRLEVFAQTGDKSRGRGGGGAGEGGEVAAEAAVDDELGAVVGFVEFEEEDALVILC